MHAFLVHANTYAWPAYLLARIPVFITSSRSCHGIGTVRDWVTRLAFQHSDAIICNGEAVRSFIAQHYGVPEEKSVVIYNGLDLNRFPASLGLSDKEKSGSSQKNRRIITIGRLVAAKDLTLFLDAAALMIRDKVSAHFMIVGDGSCRDTLEEYATQKGLAEHVSFLGERTDIPELLHGADVFWLTSAWEGLPNVLLEAMACARPVVTRDVGACGELVSHEVSGYLVSERNAEQFSQYTQELLSNPVRAKEMGQTLRDPHKIPFKYT